MKLKNLLIALFLGCSICSLAIPKYDDGRLTILGVVLLQDSEDDNAYYYVPQFPRLAMNDHDQFEFLCLKYVGKKPEDNGGLFHALVEFSLTEQEIAAIETELKKKSSRARIVGQVPLMEAVKDGEGGGVGGFRIISATLSESESTPGVKVVSSGKAPLMPGSKAAVAARLDQASATLLWSSLEGPTSDISVAIEASYEALVKGYNAEVKAEMNTLYEHFSELHNKQGGHTKRQVQNIVDSLVQTGILEVNVMDRSKGLNIKTKDMENILNLVTDRLLDLMFDTESGWAQIPEKVEAVEKGQIPGRRGDNQSTGEKVGEAVMAITNPAAGLLKSAFNDTYIPDNQYVLKNIKDIRTFKFYLNLSKSTTIRVPVATSGNLGGVYSRLKEDPTYFRIVNLDDPDFQSRDVHFQIDAEFVESFDEIINFVSVNFRKKYKTDHEDVTKQVIFNYQNVKQGATIDAVAFPRLGESSSDWTDYDYQVSWSMQGSEQPVTSPPTSDQWHKDNAPIISLRPPFEKKVIEIEADPDLMAERGIMAVSVDIASSLNGEVKVLKTARIRANAPESSQRIAVYHDENEKVVSRTIWYTADGEIKEDHVPVEADYIFLIPPKN